MLLPCLLDIYGSLLSDRRRELLEYYYNDDYSLSEISELTGISRQGIRDSIKKSEAELNTLEEKLGMYKQRLTVLKNTATARSAIDGLKSGDTESISSTAEIILDALSAVDRSMSGEAEDT